MDNLFARSDWALRSTVRQATRHSPGQLAFGRDMIMQLHLNIAWNDILHRKYQAMLKANANENKGRVPHRCKVGDKVFALHDKTSHMRPRKLSDPREGPYRTIKVFKHGNAVRINRNRTKEIFPITRIKPHFRRNINIFKSMNDNKDAPKNNYRWKSRILRSEKASKSSKYPSQDKENTRNQPKRKLAKFDLRENQYHQM